MVAGLMHAGGGEQRLEEPTAFGAPLHAQEERMSGQFQALDHAILSPGYSSQAFAQVILGRGLMMVGVDHEAGRHVQGAGQHAARLHLDGMLGGIITAEP